MAYIMVAGLLFTCVASLVTLIRILTHARCGCVAKGDGHVMSTRVWEKAGWHVMIGMCCATIVVSAFIAGVAADQSPLFPELRQRIICKF